MLVYRVCDLITADKPTWYVAQRTATIRRDRSIRIDRSFPQLAGVGLRRARARPPVLQLARGRGAQLRGAPAPGPRRAPATRR